MIFDWVKKYIIINWYIPEKYMKKIDPFYITRNIIPIVKDRQLSFAKINRKYIYYF